MTMTQDQIAPKMKLGEDLKKIIDKAIKKVQGIKKTIYANSFQVHPVDICITSHFEN